MMTAQPGTYALVLRCDACAQVQVGRWGRLSIKPSFYIYVGSAFGSGGVRARVQRHCRAVKRQHWHIDYLRAHLEPLGAWYGYDKRELEHQWACNLASAARVNAIKGFGCSDCQCYAHLFSINKNPLRNCMADVFTGNAGVWLLN